MALNLKSQRTLDAIDRLAALTGESKVEAVTSAVEEKIAAVLAAQARSRDVRSRAQAMREIALQGAALAAQRGIAPTPGGGDAADILYDEAGLPA